MAAKPHLIRRLLTIGLLAAAFAASTGVVIYFAMRGRIVAVPNVIGKSEADASEELDDAGLRMAVKGRAYSDQAPANTVSDQMPPAGSAVKSGQQVRVTVSMGLPQGSNGK